MGFGLVFTPTVGIALSDVVPDEAGLVSGVTNVSAQIGGSIGVALLASVAAGRSSNLLARGVATRMALIDGFHLSYVVAGACTTVAFLVAAVILRSGVAAMDPDAMARAEAVPIME
jgi:hypothetical protein